MGKKLNLKPRAKIKAFSSIGTEPTIMLTGPEHASQKVFKRAKMNSKDIDLFEVNEAFAVVPMAVIKELSIPRDILNINGGACALGHPVGASGARVVATLINSLRNKNLKKGIASLCIGGGEATAISLELLD